MTKKPKDFDWQEFFDFLKDEIPRKHYEFVRWDIYEAFRMRDEMSNEINNTINYYRNDIPDCIKHHVEQLLRIKLSTNHKATIDREYKKILKVSMKCR